MCGRFTVLSYDEVAAVAAAVERRLAPPVLSAVHEPRSQAFPGNTIPLISPNEAGTPEVSQAIWGFQTEWSKRLVFNTRIESAIGGSAMWREAAEQGRCLIPVATFFEPHATETVPSPRTGRPLKRPYEFASPAGAPLLLAGMRLHDRCSIVTCEPNRSVAPIHDRMPLILRFEEVGMWLSPQWPDLADRRDVELSVQPEPLEAPEQPEQLSLFD